MQMPSGLPARVVVVCTLIFGVAIAHAERRPVAVIDLSGDPATATLAADLNPVLLGHPDLQPIANPSMVVELYGSFRDADQDLFDEALTRKKTAEDQLGRYSFDSAHESALNGQRDLQQAAPTPAVVALYAQLAFVDGQAMLGMPRLAVDAPRVFALAHRLDPAFAPDPARYLPDVVQAFEAAKQRWTGKGALAIAGTGRLYIDGKDHGSAPAEIEVDAGPHVVWLTGGERVTTARPILVEPGRKTKLEIADAPADLRLKVRRARAALRKAPDPAARAAAMRVVAELVGVRDAVLLTSANNKIVVQTWNAGTRDQAPGFSALRELKNEKAADLLLPLAPPKPKAEAPDPGPGVKPIVDERPWYRRRPYQVTIGLGIAAALITGYYIYKAASDDDVEWNNNITGATPPAVMRW